MLQKGVFMQSQAQCDFNYMGYRLDSRNVIGETASQVCVPIRAIKSGWAPTRMVFTSLT